MTTGDHDRTGFDALRLHQGLEAFERELRKRLPEGIGVCLHYYQLGGQGLVATVSTEEGSDDAALAAAEYLTRRAEAAEEGAKPLRLVDTPAHDREEEGLSVFLEFALTDADLQAIRGAAELGDGEPMDLADVVEAIREGVSEHLRFLRFTYLEKPDRYPGRAEEDGASPCS